MEYTRYVLEILDDKNDPVATSESRAFVLPSTGESVSILPYRGSAIDELRGRFSGSPEERREHEEMALAVQRFHDEYQGQYRVTEVVHPLKPKFHGYHAAHSCGSMPVIEDDDHKGILGLGSYLRAFTGASLPLVRVKNSIDTARSG